MLKRFSLIVTLLLAIGLTSGSSVYAVCVTTGSPTCNVSGGWRVCPTDLNQCCDNNGAECPPAPPPTSTPRTGPPYASPTPVVTCGGLYDECCPGGSCNSPFTCSTNGSNLCFNSCQSAGGTCSVACNPLNSTSTGLPGCGGVTSQCCVPNTVPTATASPLCDGTGVDTALGCLHAGSPQLLIIELLNWAVVLGVGIAFLMIIFAGFQIATASGDPKRVKAGQELITSAISGLLLIIFSIVLLNFIGVKLLGLPGFVGNSSI